MKASKPCLAVGHQQHQYRRQSLRAWMFLVLVVLLLSIDPVTGALEEKKQQRLDKKEIKQEKKAARRQKRLEKKARRKHGKHQKNDHHFTSAPSAPKEFPWVQAYTGLPATDVSVLAGQKYFPEDEEEGEDEFRGTVGGGTNTTDRVVQNSLTQTAPSTRNRKLTPLVRTNYEGIPNYMNYAPPDVNGAVGKTHYVQTVNVMYAVYDKMTGQELVSPRQINSLFTGSGLTTCEEQNQGDPLVLYDKWNDRWIIAQSSSYPSGVCVVVSRTGDPTASYNRFYFNLSTTSYDDYPKMGLWRDTLYFTFNVFTNYHFDGGRVLAINYADLLDNTSPPRALAQRTEGWNAFFLPADVDSYLQPPEGAAGVFMQLSGTGINLWRANVNWASPSSEFLSGPTYIPVEDYLQGCPYPEPWNCVPQKGTTDQLDGLSDRLMNRLAYRNMGTYDTIVATHAVQVNYGDPTQERMGCRWYEIRNICVGSPLNQVYQQSTFAPLEVAGQSVPSPPYRWLGTMAMDSAGNIALGYSLSSAGIYAGMAFTGRLAQDPLGIMTQGETIVKQGQGYQTVNRWGDYASMSIDPVDNCTLWFTHEYVAADGWGNWRTRITGFQFPGCSPTPAPTPHPTGPSPAPTMPPTPAPTTDPPGSCAAAPPVTVGTNSLMIVSSGTTVVMEGSNCVFNYWPESISNSNFFTFTPVASGMFVFSTCNLAGFDSKIAVMSGCLPSDGVLTCNDDNPNLCGGYTSLTSSIYLQGGTNYYVVVGGWSKDTAVAPTPMVITAVYDTKSPTGSPTKLPTPAPPTWRPTSSPTFRPTTARPSRRPTRVPTRRPTRRFF